MKGKAEEHLPGGRLLQIKLEYGDFINNAELSGNIEFDPPEAASEIERCLLDIEIVSSEDGIANIIEDTLHLHHARMHGASAHDIARLVKKATGSE